MENSFADVARSFDTPLIPLLDSLNTHFDHSFHDSSDQLDQDRCYLMEIEQLKRQNNFLKKKIAQLNKKHPALSNNGANKRKSLPVHVKRLQSNITLPDQNYIVSFFEEIIRLLQSFGTLFKISTQPTLSTNLLAQEAKIVQLTKEYPEQLNKKLARLLLEPEEKRYIQLLGIFQGYYKETADKNRDLKAKIEQLTTQAIDLGKKMAQNIKTKQKIKGSRILSVYNGKQGDSFSAMKQSFIKSTWTESQLDLSECKVMLGKDKLFENIF